MGVIYLVRHGQAAFATEDYDRLSPLGQQQAGHLGAWFATLDLPPARIFSGTLRRHQQTAQACLARWGWSPATGIESDAGLDEYDFSEVLARWRPDLGSLAGVQTLLATSERPARAFADAFFAAMARWCHGEHDGEYRLSWRQFRALCVACLQGLAGRHGSQPLILFSSGGPITALVQHALDLPDACVPALARSFCNGGVTKLFHHSGRFGLSYLNNVAHLESAGSALLTYR